MIKIESFSPYITSDDDKKVNLFRQASINLTGGEGLAVIGPNGSGKSTLIKSILGIHSTYDGSIQVKQNVKIGYMPQNYRGALLSWLSIREHFKRSLNIDEQKHAEHFLSEVKFSPSFDQQLVRLSGGELQLVLLATILGKDADLLLLDEPLSAIDFSRREKVTEILDRVVKKKHKTLIMVSHQLDEPKVLCDKLIVISGFRNQAVKQIPVSQDLSMKNLSS